MDYREAHQDPGHGVHYDALYSRGFFKHQWSEIEQILLREQFERFPNTTRSGVLFDFGCGTGRITEFCAGFFPEVVGIDISGEMLGRARVRCVELANVSFIESEVGEELGKDMAQAASVVTAFRLLTNADESLRQSIVDAAFQVLSPGGYLIVNSHVTPRSPRGLLYAGEASIRRSLGQEARPFFRTMGYSDMSILLKNAGFETIDFRYYSALPTIPRFAPLTPRRALTSFERFLGGRRWNQCLLMTARRPD